MLSEYKFPMIDVFSISKTSRGFSQISAFFVNSIPRNSSELLFNIGVNQLVDCSNFFIGLREGITKFTKRIVLCNLKITGNEFCSLIKAAKAIESFWINWSKIETDIECDFEELQGCKIQDLYLVQCGTGVNSNWTENKERCFNIINGIHKCINLLNSLKNLFLMFAGDKKIINDLGSEIEERFDWALHENGMRFKVSKI